MGRVGIWDGDSYCILHSGKINFDTRFASKLSYDHDTDTFTCTISKKFHFTPDFSFFPTPFIPSFALPLINPILVYVRRFSWRCSLITTHIHYVACCRCRAVVSRSYIAVK